jgi:hypothetical protein
VEKFNLDLSKVSRLGGHSEKRTHRGGQQFPGMTITYALMEKVGPGRVGFGRRPFRCLCHPTVSTLAHSHGSMLPRSLLPVVIVIVIPSVRGVLTLRSQLEDLAESTPDRVKILKKARVTKCIKEGDKVVGVEYEKDGKHVSGELPHMRLVSSRSSSLNPDPPVHRARHRHSRYRWICRRLHRRLAPQEVPTRVL